MTATIQLCYLQKNIKYKGDINIMATKKTTKTTKPAERKSIDQMTVARTISQKFHLKLSEVVAIIEEEQKLTMEYVRNGFRVIKKNYLTLEGKKCEGKKNWKSPLNGKVYNLAPTTRVYVRIGDGFKRYIDGNKKMPNKMCRFVSEADVPPAN